MQLKGSRKVKMATDLKKTTKKTLETWKAGCIYQMTNPNSGLRW